MMCALFSFSYRFLSIGQRLEKVQRLIDDAASETERLVERIASETDE